VNAGPEDLETHLLTQRRTFMATIRTDGSPTCHPMGTFYADGELYLTMYAKSAKHRNLSRDPRICCLVSSSFDEGTPPSSHYVERKVSSIAARRFSSSTGQPP
jgi:nitroimidazol reductase NimA-like FMN-containing flavoprotein (pyridoxamine 5'-phosphate oxidase superfamily)